MILILLLVLLNYKIILIRLLAQMSSLISPFLFEIQECKQSMRKLRKKIYKHCTSSKQKSKKQRDSTDEILQIFRRRNVPEFITQNLKKRRSFDFVSIKNISINTTLPLEDIQNRASHQEHQVNSLYCDHKKRLEEIRTKALQNKQQSEPFFNMNLSNIYSSTNEDDCLRSMEEMMPQNEVDQAEEVFYDNFSQQSKQAVFTNHYLHMDLNQSSLNSDMVLFNF